jgi:AcrR family transcriptional regulator
MVAEADKKAKGGRGAPLRRPKRPDKAPKRGRESWLDQARHALIAEGIDRVRVDPLARLLGVTTGSFYHHFKNRQELLDGLLEHWEAKNSGPMFQAVDTAGPDPDDQFDALLETWLSESEYDPQYDSAVRAWAHGDPAVSEVVRRVDDHRIALLQRIFTQFGYDAERAFIRARITYFQQVGYQAMEVVESATERRRIYHLYREALKGDPPPVNQS